jgi:hypothetical protein
VGSQFNAIDELRRYEQAGARPDLLDVALLRGQADKLTRDLKAFGLAAVFPFPEDFLRASYTHSVEQRRASFDLIRSNPQLCGYNLTGMLDHGMTGEGMWTLWREWKPGVAEVLRDSQRRHARHRLITFDLIRSNPAICGYNVTGMLDHGMTGEGLWTFWREWKPGALEALTDGWAPVRWCLFARPLHGYADQPLVVEAVLANEDVVAAGNYPVRLRLVGPQGVLWERAT